MVKTTNASRGGAVLALAVYSDNRSVREQVVAALGNTLADDLPPVSVTQFATAAALIAALDESVFDCVILDGEAAPLGGMGVSYQIKDEFNDPPPTVLLVARQVDGWLATWSRADGVAPMPIDPLMLPNVVADVIRADQAGTLDDTILVPGAASRH
ncbi:MAG: response regulator [Propionibacteriaceae bacterium]|nr:response regulator [Propionibacteriaceae bacterium]